LWPPVLKRAAGRPRSRRIKLVAEGGSRKRKRCKRCGQLGHMQKKLAMRRCMTQMIHLLHNQNQRVTKPRRRKYQPAQVHLKIRGPKRRK